MGSQQNNADPKTKRQDRFRENLANSVQAFDQTVDRLDDDLIYIKSLVFKAPDDDRVEWMVVIRSRTEEGDMVGFHLADTFSEVLKGTINRLENRSIKWRHDQHA